MSLRLNHKYLGSIVCLVIISAFVSSCKKTSNAPGATANSENNSAVAGLDTGGSTTPGGEAAGGASAAGGANAGADKQANSPMDSNSNEDENPTKPITSNLISPSMAYLIADSQGVTNVYMEQTNDSVGPFTGTTNNVSDLVNFKIRPQDKSKIVSGNGKVIQAAGNSEFCSSIRFRVNLVSSAGGDEAILSKITIQPSKSIGKILQATTCSYSLNNDPLWKFTVTFNYTLKDWCQLMFVDLNHYNQLKELNDKKDELAKQLEKLNSDVTQAKKDIAQNNPSIYDTQINDLTGQIKTQRTVCDGMKDTDTVPYKSYCENELANLELQLANLNVSAANTQAANIQATEKLETAQNALDTFNTKDELKPLQGLIDVKKGEIDSSINISSQILSSDDKIYLSALKGQLDKKYLTTWANMNDVFKKLQLTPTNETGNASCSKINKSPLVDVSKIGK